MVPWIFGPESFAAAQLTFSLFTAGIFAFFGVLILMLWVPMDGRRPSETVKEHVREGYACLAMAVLCLVFGLYFISLVVVLIVMMIVYVLWQSTGIL